VQSFSLGGQAKGDAGEMRTRMLRGKRESTGEEGRRRVESKNGHQGSKERVGKGNPDRNGEGLLK